MTGISSHQDYPRLVVITVVTIVLLLGLSSAHAMATAGASSDATVQASEEEAVADVTFAESQLTEPAGDVIKIEMTLDDTDDAYVKFGERSNHFIDIIHVETTVDHDNEISLYINTRLAGATVDDPETVYYSEDADVRSAIYHGDEVDAEFADESGNDLGDFEGYLEELDLIDSGETPFDQIVRPLQPTDYYLGVDMDNEFVIDDRDSRPAEPIEAGVVDLVSPELGPVQTYTAPPGDANEDTDVDALLDTATAAVEVPEGERAIVAVEAEGISGSLIYREEDFEALYDGFSPSSLQHLDETEGDGVDISFEGGDVLEDGSTTLNYDASEEDVIVLFDQSESKLYFVVDTSAEAAFEGELRDGMGFDIQLEYTGSEELYRFDNGGPDGGEDGDVTEPRFPTLALHSSGESTSGSFSVVESVGDLDQNGGDAQDEPVLTDDDDAEPANDDDAEPANDDEPVLTDDDESGTVEDSDADQPADDGIPGFNAIGAVVALLIAVGISARYHARTR